MKGRTIPWIKFFPADFMHGVRGLTAQEVGVYTMLLCRIYEENGPVEYHVTRLSTYCGMRAATFEKVAAKLIELGKLTLLNGMLSNARAESEITNRANDLKINILAGLASAQKRQQKQRKIPTDVQRTFNNTDTDKDKERDTASAASLGAAHVYSFSDLENRLREAAGAENDPSPGLLVVGPIAQAIADGADPDLDVFPIIRAKCKTGFRPRSWSYFLQPIADAKATRLAPRPEGRSATPSTTTGKPGKASAEERAAFAQKYGIAS